MVIQIKNTKDIMKRGRLDQNRPKKKISTHYVVGNKYNTSHRWEKVRKTWDSQSFFKNHYFTSSTLPCICEIQIAPAQSKVSNWLYQTDIKTMASQSSRKCNCSIVLKKYLKIEAIWLINCILIQEKIHNRVTIWVN